MNDTAEGTVGLSAAADPESFRGRVCNVNVPAAGNIYDGNKFVIPRTG